MLLEFEALESRLSPAGLVGRGGRLNEPVLDPVASVEIVSYRDTREEIAACF